MEIRMPRIERFFLGREVALKLGLTFGNNAPATRFLDQKDSRYLRATTIAENDCIYRHHQSSPLSDEPALSSESKFGCEARPQRL
jgi:hypothetical protein